MRFAFTPLAAAELKDAAHSYESKQPGLGFDFTREVAHALSSLLLYPKNAPDIDGIFRRKPIARFPFVIVHSMYRNGILVTAILPTHSDPKRIAAGLSAHS